ncbi:MAG: transcriptional regulator [Desulfobacterales bacterium]|nr:MAG: transcriptional regulator [Desulfobacterales bacterium]
MPIYEFKCNACTKEFEQILPSSDISSVTCDECGSSDVTKMLSSASFKLGRGSSSPTPLSPASGCGGSGFS